MTPADPSLWKPRTWAALSVALLILVVAAAIGPRLKGKSPPLSQKSDAQTDTQRLSPATQPVDHPEQVPGGSAPLAPQEVSPIDGQLLQLQQLLLAKDDDATIRALVDLGARLRSHENQQDAQATIVRWIKTSNNPQLVGLLIGVLAAYGELPDALLAATISSARIPSSLVPCIANIGTLASLPREWERDKQRVFWEQLLLRDEALLPGLSVAAAAKLSPRPRSGWILPSPNDVLVSIPTRRLAAPDTISAVLQRGLGDAELGGWILRSARASVDLSDEQVAARVSALWADSLGVDVKRALVDWLSDAPRATASREMLRIYAAEVDANIRKDVGAALVRLDPSAAATTFRILWTQEHDEDVQETLIHALRCTDDHASLDELARVHEMSSGAARVAAERELISIYNTDHSEVARQTLQQLGIPIPPTNTNPFPIPGE